MDILPDTKCGQSEVISAQKARIDELEGYVTVLLADRDSTIQALKEVNGILQRTLTNIEPQD